MACDADAIAGYSEAASQLAGSRPPASLREFATSSCDCSLLKFSSLHCVYRQLIVEFNYISLRVRVASSVVFYTLILRTIKLLTWLVTYFYTDTFTDR